MSAERILIVDDDEQVRRHLTRLLERTSYLCTQARDTTEARVRLGESDHALILCDMNMPGESGLALIRHVHETHKSTAIVMVTGEDDAELAGAALELGAYGYIIKPYRANEVLINVANALRRHAL